MTRVPVLGELEPFLGTQNCAKSFTPSMAQSPHNDPLSLERGTLGRVLGALKGRMTGVFRDSTQALIKGGQ